MVQWSKYIVENKIIALKNHLTLAFQSGDICLYDDENDMNPIKFTTNLKIITKADWKVNGDCFAVCDFVNEGDSKGSKSFYNADGEFINNIKITEPIV